MKRLLVTFVAFATLVLSILGGASVAYAADPAGERFCSVPMKSAQDLHDRLATAGDGQLKGCRATWRHFAAIWKQEFPNVKFDTREEVMAFVSQLKAEEAKADYQYSSACLHERPDGSRDAIPDCATREARKGETIYTYGNKAALMSSCVNPGVAVIPPIVVKANPCVEVHFPTQVAQGQQAVRFAYIGRKNLPGRCIALQRAGGAKVTDLPEECPDTYKEERGGRMVTIVCTWDSVEEEASRLLGYNARVQNVSGSFYIRATGDNVLYLPMAALDGETAICWELPNGEFVTYGVRRANFINGVATIPPERVYGQ